MRTLRPRLPLRVIPPLPVETGLSILVLVESPVPGRPALTYVPFFPTDTESPGRPSVAETPRLPRLMVRPGRILMRLRKDQAMGELPLR